MTRKAYQVEYTSGKREVLNLSDEEVRLLRFNQADETKIVCTILPADYKKAAGSFNSRRVYAR